MCIRDRCVCVSPWLWVISVTLPAGKSNRTLSKDQRKVVIYVRLKTDRVLNACHSTYTHQNNAWYNWQVITIGFSQHLPSVEGECWIYLLKKECVLNAHLLIIIGKELHDTECTFADIGYELLFVCLFVVVLVVFLFLFFVVVCFVVVVLFFFFSAESSKMNSVAVLLQQNAKQCYYILWPHCSKNKRPLKNLAHFLKLIMNEF